VIQFFANFNMSVFVKIFFVFAVIVYLLVLLKIVLLGEKIRKLYQERDSRVEAEEKRTRLASMDRTEHIKKEYSKLIDPLERRRRSLLEIAPFLKKLE